MDAAELESRIEHRRIEIAALERFVFSRPASETDRADIERAEHKLVELQIEQIRDERAQVVVTAEVTSRVDNEDDRAATIDARGVDEPLRIATAPTVDASRGRQLLTYVFATSVIAVLVIIAFLAIRFDESSLRVFDREQTPSEAEFASGWLSDFADSTSWRLLDSEERWDVYAFLVGEGDICIYVDYGGSGGSNCTAREKFTEQGIEYPAITPFYDQDANAWKVVTFSWGPRDGLQTALDVVDRPEP
jgi:hypothetical protein